MGPRPGEDQAPEQAGHGWTHPHGGVQLGREAHEARPSHSGGGEEGAAQTLHSLQQLHLPGHHQGHHANKNHGGKGLLVRVEQLGMWGKRHLPCCLLLFFCVSLSIVEVLGSKPTLCVCGLVEWDDVLVWGAAPSLCGCGGSGYRQRPPVRAQ